ncbi:unnamed protein product [Mytilus coruscus]|uniref:Uncharacterized protein n=1 Tax=Mytilus coruscus TaxID=42192 RepID=A0A6J8AVL0_MYTCO|nr:unnamed protein product [Mytilus coruscus]
MDAKGNHINVYERDLNSELIFEIPLAITTSRNSNIFITDDIKCRVVVLGVDGDVQNTHTGRSIVGSGQCPFKPAGIITTPEDNIIVANSLNDALHVLDNCGNFLTCVITKELGILYPYALATTATGQYQFLYIACWTPDDSCEKAKLYKLKFSGC